MCIGQRIKLARRRLGITQKEIADLFGISPQAVGAWENCETDPDPEKYAALRTKLRITFAYLILGAGLPPDPSDPQVLLEDRTVAEYSRLVEKERPAKGKTPRRA